MRRPHRRTTLSLGTMSEGTLRPEDLVPAIVAMLEDLRLSRSERAIVQEAQTFLASDWDVDTDNAREEKLTDLYDDLVRVTENHCPDYAYFGSTGGDGACIGVWPDSDLLQAGNRTHADDVVRSEWLPSEWREQVGRPGQPADDHGCAYFLHVNDHGNATLYRRAGRRWLEVWSVV